MSVAARPELVERFTRTNQAWTSSARAETSLHRAEAIKVPVNIATRAFCLKSARLLRPFLRFFDHGARVAGREL